MSGMFFLRQCIVVTRCSGCHGQCIISYAGRQGRNYRVTVWGLKTCLCNYFWTSVSVTTKTGQPSAFRNHRKRKICCWYPKLFTLKQADKSLRSLFSWSLPQYRPAASIFGHSDLNSACGLNFRSFGPQLDPGSSAALWALQYARQRWWCVTSVTTSVWRHSQSLCTALLRLKRCGYKIFEKVKFSQTDDPSATYLHSPCPGQVRHGPACKISRPCVVPFRS